MLSEGFATTPASPWSSHRPRLHNKLKCRNGTDVPSLPSQGAYSRTASSPQICGAKCSSQQFKSPTGRRALQYTAQYRISRCMARKQVVTFTGTPQGVRQMQEDERHHDELAGPAYANDVMVYTSFLGLLMLGSSRRASRDEVEKLRKEIESMLRENADRRDSSEESGIPTAETSAPSPGSPVA